jgi:membrane-bound serine protease (ClpP class)
MKVIFSRLVCAALALGACTGKVPTRPVPVHAAGAVATITLAGPIGPAAAEYFDDAMNRAGEDSATAIVLRLDTPGGLSESMQRIITRILASKVPVLGYVAPDGARAASAGTYILYACQIAAMAPATHLGAATPVVLGSPRLTPPSIPKDTGAKPKSSEHSDTANVGDIGTGDAESNKLLNDAIAYIRSLAQLRGRNPEWAEQAVRVAATLTASEALDKHVIDYIAVDVADLLRQADGRQVHVGERSLTLALEGRTVQEYAPNWRTAFLLVITQPTLAYILLLAGIYGLILEVLHPGMLLPGIVGTITLLIGLYALQMLPVNYAGLALMTFGVGLLIAETLVPTVGALGIGGVVAFVLGSILLFDRNVPGYAVNLGVIGGIALCAIVLLALVLWFATRARRARHIGGDQQMLDASGTLLEATDANGEAWAQIYGERWRVCADAPLPAGARVRVVRRQGLLLWIVPE